MKKYIEASEYKAKYKDLEGQDLEAYLEIASIAINLATLTRIEKIGFENLTPEQQELIKKATIEEVHFFADNDVFEDTELDSYSITDISANEKETVASRLGVSKVALLYLKRTGLTSRII